ncbi:hypothetical protein DFR40_0364 [Azonexus fungiphilus]|jgi:hypothetical protein|uniref:Uracil-DNA glycosylase n=1 Tax=Azonexus fungiphilus TaxID=146940 RepID=A0A495WME0_9RHOO|nr:hypothetical protein [Azonexus fungiphilus]NHC08008.1 hypothetical protein [Azonexus fungiphilus]RKT62477.1 hypothetical protein DFR40_0364 [Azonexus fungiphilus]
MDKEQPASPRCRNCRHYHITFDPNFPYGCRELGFRSAREPARDVLESSGQPCLYFVARPRKA